MNDFVYQDNYVDGRDAYRHSGWLSYGKKIAHRAYAFAQRRVYLYFHWSSWTCPIKIARTLFLERRTAYRSFPGWNALPSFQKTKEMVEYILCYQKSPNKIRFQAYKSIVKATTPFSSPTLRYEIWHFRKSLSLRLKATCIKQGLWNANQSCGSAWRSGYRRSNQCAPHSDSGKFVWTQASLKKSSSAEPTNQNQEHDFVLWEDVLAPEVQSYWCFCRGRDQWAGEEWAFEHGHSGFWLPKAYSLIRYFLRFLPKKELCFWIFSRVLELLLMPRWCPTV